VTTTVFHSRAERFAQLLEEAGGAPRRHVRSAADETLTPLVAVGHRVSRLRTNVEPDPDFRTSLRAMLVATAERDGIGVTDTAPEVGPREALAARLRTSPRRPSTVTARRARTRARAAVIVGIAAGTLALSGMSAASGDAMPGDALYGIKRSTERAQLALAGSDLSRGQLYFEFAKTRVAEARAVRQDTAGLDGVLDDMDRETTQGTRLLTTAAVDRRNPAAIDAVAHFVGVQRRNVSALLDLPSPDARKRVQESLSLLNLIDGRTAALRATLTCNGSRDADQFGPLPTTCGAMAPGTGAVPGAPVGSGTAEPGRPEPPLGGTGGGPPQQDHPRDLGGLLGGLLGNQARQAGR